MNADIPRDLAAHQVKVVSIIKDDGLPFSPAEILARMRKLLETDAAAFESLPIPAAELSQRLSGALETVEVTAAPEATPDF